MGSGVQKRVGKQRGGRYAHWQFHGAVRSRWEPVAERFCPLALRKLVYQRDAGQCQYCAAPTEFEKFHVDHVVPWSRGGQTVLTNLVVSCRGCNMAKFADQIPGEMEPDTSWERPQPERSRAWRKRADEAGRPPNKE